MDASEQDQRRKAKRQDRNRREYEKSKAKQDQLLLRLNKGDLARLDSASDAIGVSRAAFARMFLAPTLGTVASRMRDIDRAKAERGQSLSQFLAAAIDSALADSPLAPNSTAAADEFDALFGSGVEDD